MLRLQNRRTTFDDAVKTKRPKKFYFGEDLGRPHIEKHVWFLSSIFNVERPFQRYLPKQHECPQKSSKYLLLKAFKCWVQLSQRRAHVIWRHRATSQHSRFFPIIPFLSLLDCGHKLYIEVIIYFHQANQLGIVSDEWLCSLNLSVTDTGCNHWIINLSVTFYACQQYWLLIEENINESGEDTCSLHHYGIYMFRWKFKWYF